MPVWEEGKTVLLVFGYSALRRQLRKFIEDNGLTVLAAASAKEGLELASAHRGHIHLLMSEVQPPDMPGRELLARIRQNRPGIPALVLSPEPEDVLAETFGFPGVSFIETPFAWCALADRLGAFLA